MKGDFTRRTFEPTKHYSAVLDQQGRVKTDADKLEEVAIESHLRQETLRDIVGISGAPAENPGFGLRTRQGDLIIGAGHYYVDGILCENEQDISFTEQPDLPGQVLPSTVGDTLLFLAYLDVWERHITAIEDPDIREVALGGPDTTTRKQTVCGVRLFEVAGDAHCLSPLPDWEQAIAPGDGRLAARARPPENPDNLCLVPPGAGFTGLGNQLYRVEIHQGGGPGDATFKWDRDNGSVAFPIEEFLDGQPTDRIRVRSVGKSDVRSLQRGDQLEISDDIGELNGEPGLLRHVELTDPTTGTITLDELVDGLSQDHHPKVRRWSGGQGITVPVDGETFIPLENGVEVRFLGELFRAGDYWLIPARTATGDVEWPSQINEDGEPEPLLLPPLGIKHHYCRLALLEFGGGAFSVVADCRNIFRALSGDTLKIVRVETVADNQVLAHNSMIRAVNLLRGLNIEFNAPLSEDVFSATALAGQGINPAVEVQLSLPEPSDPDDRDFWGLEANEFFGFRSIKLASSISLNDRRDRLEWRLTDSTRSWLQRLFSRLIPPGVAQPVAERLPCALRLLGSFIWADGPGGDRVFLDGETAANPRRRGIGLDLPSGNGQPGGDFYTWFWIVSDNVEVPLTLSVSVRLNVVSGLVSSGGAPVEGATIRLRRISGPGPEVDSEQTTQSDAAGRFTFTALEGDYTVIAEALGATAEQAVEVGPVRVSPGGGGGGGGVDGPGDLTVREINGISQRFAELLEASGVRSVEAFLSLLPSRIAQILPVSEEGAGRLLENARRLPDR